MRAPGPFRTLGAPRFALRSLAHDLPLKAVALLIAVVLWVTIVQAAGREVDGQLDAIPVDRPALPEGFVLRGSLGEVTVRVRGTPAALGALTREQVHATVEVSLIDAGPEPQDARVVVRLDSEAAKVAAVMPASIPVRVERVTERTVGVQARFANEPPSGFVPREAAIAPPQVSISGPESAVAAVAAVYATVRFGDVGIDVVQNTQAVAVDADGVPVDGVAAAPEAVEVRVPLLPTSTTRTLPVLFVLRGDVAPGYWISRITTDPVAVTVRGAPDALSALERLETAAVNVSGLSGSRSVVVPLLMPAGVAMLEPRDATVNVTVTALSGTRPFPIVAVQAIGLTADRSAHVEPPSVSIVLSGSIPALNGVTADEVLALIEVSGLAPGTYELPVTVSVPGDVTLGTVQPQRVTVTISQR